MRDSNELRNSRSAVLGLSLLTLALAAAGQTLSPGEVTVRSWVYQPPAAALRVESNEVRVGVVVRNGRGDAVGGLKPADFRVYEDGKPQLVSSFLIVKRGASASAATRSDDSPLQQKKAPPPRYVALYFDDLHTRSPDMQHVRVAAENFVRHGLAPNDQVGLFTASSSATLRFTPDASKILDAIEKLGSHARSFESADCPRITPNDAYLIANNLDTDAYNTALAAAKECNCDSVANWGTDCYSQQEQIVKVQAREIWEAMRELSENTLETLRAVVGYVAKMPGERVLVVASPGFFTGTLDSDVDGIVDEALRGGIVINALDAKGLYTEDPSRGRIQNELSPTQPAYTMAAKHEGESFVPDLMGLTGALTDFSVGTGGLFFHNRNDMIAGYSSIGAEPETEYLLAFAPQNSKMNGQFHKLKVEVSPPRGFFVEARPGYFAPTKAAEPAQQAPADKLDEEVKASDERTDFPVAVRDTVRAANSSAPIINVESHVDIEKLPFEREKDRRVEKLTFVDALYDSHGNFVAGKAGEMDFALLPQSYERLVKIGINASLSLEAPGGKYRLRAVVQEGVKGKFATKDENVQIPQ